MLKMSQIQTFTQKSDFIQTTFDLKVWIQTFAENSDQSGRPASSLDCIAAQRFLQNVSEFSHILLDSPDSSW